MLNLNLPIARSADSVQSRTREESQRGGPPPEDHSRLGIRPDWMEMARLIAGFIVFAIVAVCVSAMADAAGPVAAAGPVESPYQRLELKIERSETDAAIALGGLESLGRIDKAARLKSLYEAMIKTERERIQLRNSMARRREAALIAAQQRREALAVANSTALDASSRRVQPTTYHDSVTLLRPNKKIAVGLPEEADLSEAAAIEQRQGYQPLVVSKPPTEHLESENAKPTTPIGVANVAQITPPDPEPVVKSAIAPTAIATAPATARKAPKLESVAVDESLLGKPASQSSPTAPEQLASAIPSLPKPPVLPKPPAFSKPASLPKPARNAAVVVANLPSHDSIQDQSDPTSVAARDVNLAELMSATPVVAINELTRTEPTVVEAKPVDVTPPLQAPKVARAPATPQTTAPQTTAPRPQLTLPATALAVTAPPVTAPTVTEAEATAPTTTTAASDSVAASEPEPPASTNRLPAPPIASATADVTANVTTNTLAKATSPVQTSDAQATVATTRWPFALGGGGEQLPMPKGSGSDVTLSVDNVDVRTVLEMLAKGYGMNILVAPDVEGTVTANVTGLTPEQTLSSIVRMCGLAIQREDNVILVYPKDNQPRESRQLRVFPLDFARAELIEPTVTGLLSPIGSAYTSTVDELDNRSGREAIVVIDTPDILAEVERYVMQADQPPRQVMIEARVLEVELRDEMEHGVNLENLVSGDVRTGAFRLTDNVATSTNPFFFAEISGSELDALITMLETTTDAKTLATPRVMVVNGQNAKIQVGQQLGFAVATVTQTSTIQDVRYLDTGIVLQVTPTISRDNRVLLQVKPKVSSGEINPDTLLPEETTREVETSVMLDNHQGMIIGGLIQEDDRVVIRKMPWLGDVKYVGKLFQRRETARARTEVIVALIPHIVDPANRGQFSNADPCREQIEWERTENRLFNGPLNRECRPWEARLPDVTGEDGFHRDIDRQRNRNPYGKGCEPIKTGLLSFD